MVCRSITARKEHLSRAGKQRLNRRLRRGELSVFAEERLQIIGKYGSAGRPIKSFVQLTQRLLVIRLVKWFALEPPNPPVGDSKWPSASGDQQPSPSKVCQ